MTGLKKSCQVASVALAFFCCAVGWARTDAVQAAEHREITEADTMRQVEAWEHVLSAERALQTHDIEKATLHVTAAEQIYHELNEVSKDLTRLKARIQAESALVSKRTGKVLEEAQALGARSEFSKAIALLQTIDNPGEHRDTIRQLVGEYDLRLRAQQQARAAAQQSENRAREAKAQVLERVLAAVKSGKAREAQEQLLRYKALAGFIDSETFLKGATKLGNGTAKRGEPLMVSGKVISVIAGEGYLLRTQFYRHGYNLDTLVIFLKSSKDLGWVDGDEAYCGVIYSGAYSYRNAGGALATVRAADFRVKFELP
jgi:hypothetical protein